MKTRRGAMCWWQKNRNSRFQKKAGRRFPAFFVFEIQILPGAAIFIGSPINPFPFLVGVDTAQYAASYTASNDAGAYRMLSANDGAKEAACHGAANGATNNLGSAGPVVCNITGIGLAIALGPCAWPGLPGCRMPWRREGPWRKILLRIMIFFLSWT